jgi:hypothetical protein
MIKTKGPILLLRVEDEGKYVWEPGLSLVEFTPKGERHATRTFPLHDESNTYNGSMRVAARDLLKTHPAGE